MHTQFRLFGRALIAASLGVLAFTALAAGTPRPSDDAPHADTTSAICPAKKVSAHSRTRGASRTVTARRTNTVPTHVRVCDVAVEKDVVAVSGAPALNPPSVPLGATVTYRIRVALGPNSGSIAAKYLAVRDTTVSDDSLTNAPLVPVRVSGAIVGDDKDEVLEKGERWVYALNAYGAPVVQTAAACAGIVNSAKVTVAFGDTAPANNTATRTTSVSCAPDVAIQKSGPQTVTYGDTISYDVRITSVGDPLPITRAAIHVSDPAVSAAELVFFEELAGTGDGDDTLEPNEVWVYRLVEGAVVTSLADRCDPIINTATVMLAGETNVANNTSSVTTTVTCAVNLAIAKTTAKATYASGEAIVYTVTVRNTGQAPVPFGQIAVSDPTLPNLALVGAAPDVLAAGASVSYTGSRQTSAADCGNVVNTATVVLVGGSQMESTTADNVASAGVAVAGAACAPIAIGDPGTTLTITKLGPPSSQARAGVRYTLRITNTGAAVARNVLVRDPIPSGMTVARVPSNATLLKQQVGWSIGDLQPGQSTTVSVLLRAQRNISRRICNVGFASATNAAEVQSRSCTRFARVAGVVRLPRVTG